MKLRKYLRTLQPRRLRTALLLSRMQAVEPDPRKLKANFQTIFDRVFGKQQTHVETFEPKKP